MSSPDNHDLGPCMEFEGPWRHGAAWCCMCEHRWVAVWPCGAADLECPQCQSHNTERKATL